MESAERLIVFGRYPEPGRTKTRLVTALGALGAADLQRRLTENTVRAARTLARRRRMRVEFRFSGGSPRQVRRWLGPNLEVAQQAAGDLGRRMESAVREALGAGAARVVLVGTDVPGLTPDHLREAFEALSGNDLVLGPSTDGGYWLVGMKRPAGIFGDIPWGTGEVLERTLALARAQGATVHCLAPQSDLDTPADLKPRGLFRRRPYVSVIVPALDEEEQLAPTLARAAHEEAEVIVVDGGSRDRSREIAAGCGARVERCRAGRARQQNRGAALAQADVLLFLHADTRLPAGYPQAVFEGLMDPRVAVGAFGFRTDATGPLMRVLEFGANLRSRYLNLPYGDQALFLRRERFEAAGGFPETGIAEDFLLVRRLSEQGRIYTAPQAIRTSARRWRRLGPWRTTFRNQIVLAGLVLGIPGPTLTRLYRR